MFARARTFLCTAVAPSRFTQALVRPAFLATVMDGKRPLCSIPDLPPVEHKEDCQEFQIRFPDSRAFLQYEKDGNVFKILHTEVPKELGGRGVGKVLAEAALSHIVDHKYQAEVYCDYVQYYIEKYEPKYLKYIEK